MFYFDDTLKQYEAVYSWDESLLYLENLFINNPTYDKINSLVGFAWYYLIEGPVDSGKYEKDENNIALSIWKKYLSIGFDQYLNIPSFRFIAGYSLLMNGFYIDEYKDNYEKIALDTLHKVNNYTDNDLKEVVNIILEYQKQKKYQPLKLKHGAAETIFHGESLLEKYFKELYN